MGVQLSDESCQGKKKGDENRRPHEKNCRKVCVNSGVCPNVQPQAVKSSLGRIDNGGYIYICLQIALTLAIPRSTTQHLN
jgi:hypothetical protein